MPLWYLYVPVQSCLSAAAYRDSLDGSLQSLYELALEHLVLLNIIIL